MMPPQDITRNASTIAGMTVLQRRHHVRLPGTAAASGSQLHLSAHESLQASRLLQWRPPVLPGLSGDAAYTMTPHQVGAYKHCSTNSSSN
jgi:hypothetical protein